MFRSVVLVADVACLGRVIARTAQLPLAPDATLTLVELCRHDACDRSFLELHSLALVAPGRRIHFAWLEPSDEVALHNLIREAELVVCGDIRFFGWRESSLVGTVPVLFVRPTPVEPYQRPLVAVDPTGAVEVLQLTRKVLATKPPAMTAVHATTTFGEHARRFLSSLLSSLGAFGAGWTRYLAHGDPRTVITEAAADAHADLVVVGCRPRSWWSRLWYGSVSRGVLRDVPCDVLTVPAGAV